MKPLVHIKFELIKGRQELNATITRMKTDDKTLDIN